jgi:hypothetical protein
MEYYRRMIWFSDTDHESTPSNKRMEMIHARKLLQPPWMSLWRNASCQTESKAFSTSKRSIPVDWPWLLLFLTCLTTRLSWWEVECAARKPNWWFGRTIQNNPLENFTKRAQNAELTGFLFNGFERSLPGLRIEQVPNQIVKCFELQPILCITAIPPPTIFLGNNRLYLRGECKTETTWTNKRNRSSSHLQNCPSKGLNHRVNISLRLDPVVW